MLEKIVAQQARLQCPMATGQWPFQCAKTGTHKKHNEFVHCAIPCSVHLRHTRTLSLSLFSCVCLIAVELSRRTFHTERSNENCYFRPYMCALWIGVCVCVEFMNGRNEMDESKSVPSNGLWVWTVCVRSLKFMITAMQTENLIIGRIGRVELRFIGVLLPFSSHQTHGK